MDFKMKMAFIFQPYLLLVLLGLFATYGYYHYAENKYTALIGVAITLGNLYAYINVLISKAIILRGIENKIILTVLCLCVGFGQAKYDFGTTSSVIMSVTLIALFAIDSKFLNEILKDGKFSQDYDAKPDLTIFIQDFGQLNPFKSAKERKMKFRDELYTYINNGIKFDNKGVKGTNISVEDVKRYTQESMVSIKDFDNDSLKTLEMLKY
jgi:hypothetical protein